MAFAVSAWFDLELEARVRAIWKRLADEQLSSILHEGPYRPHITLAVYEEVDRARLSRALRHTLRTRPALPIILPALGVFNNVPPAIFLGVTVSQALAALHADVNHLLAMHGARARDHYLPDRWNPHCTLAPAIEPPKLAQAIVSVSSLKFPLVGSIDRLGVIDTPAEVELEEIALLR